MNIELYRAVIPASHVINDNHGQHYRTIMGNQNWLAQQYEAAKEGTWEVSVGRGRDAHMETVGFTMPCGFVMPDQQWVKEMVGGKQVVLHHEVWKLGDRKFDPHNYAHTFKTPLDLLVKDGYLEDDSWKYVLRTEFTGGGYAVWKDRALRWDGDGLPDEFTLDWWNSMGADKNDAFIRTLIIF